MLDDARALDPATLARVRSRFMRAMADKDVPIESANTWFERVLFYAKQTIRRERVLADAILVYKMFYIKVYHPGAFYTALLNGNIDHETRLKKYVEQLDGRGVILPLDINQSGQWFEREGAQVRVGFGTVGNLDPLVINRIIKTRGKSGFRSINEFVRKSHGKGVDETDTRRLIEAGAFDAMGEREELLESIGKPVRKRRAASPRETDTEKKSQIEMDFDRDV